MGHTLSVRLQSDLARWVDETAAATGVSQGQLVRDQLERARRDDQSGRRFMRLAGAVRLDPNLSTRKGFSKA